MAKAEAVEFEVAGRTLLLSNPQKTFFPERGETKLDLVRFYQSIEEPLLRAMGGRPVLLQRFPHGATGSSFFQTRVPALMAAIYLLILLYFKAIGGYKPVHIVPVDHPLLEWSAEAPPAADRDCGTRRQTGRRRRAANAPRGSARSW